MNEGVLHYNTYTVQLIREQVVEDLKRQREQLVGHVLAPVARYNTQYSDRVPGDQSLNFSMSDAQLRSTLCRTDLMRLLLTLLYAGAAGTPVAAEGVTLVRDSKAVSTIVISAQQWPEATRLEEERARAPWWPQTPHTAATELQTYVRRMTGAELPVVTDDQEVEGPLVLVGESRYTRDMGLNNDGFGRQEYLISADEGRLVLMGYDEGFDDWVKKTREAFVGMGPRGGPLQTWQAIGTHYAVNDFLERVCGVRWYFIGEIGEVVPQQSTLVVPRIEIRRRPWTRYRMVNRLLVPPNYYWEPRLDTRKPGEPRYLIRFPDEEIHTEAITSWGRRLKFGGDLFACNHSLYGYKGRFAEKYPEWWPDGSTSRQPCFSRQSFLDQVVEDARRFFDGGGRTGVAAGDFYSVVPHDGTGKYCECSLCRPQYDPPGRYIAGEDGGWRGGTHSNYVWGFVSRVAIELKKTHPEAVISCVGYGNYYAAPDPGQVQIPNNVAVQMTCGFGAFGDPVNRELMGKIFADWARVVKPEQFYIWSYWLWPTNPGYLNIPDVSPRMVGELIRRLKRYRFSGGVMVQNDEVRGPVWSYPALDHLRVCVLAKMLDNPDLSEDDIVDEYYTLFYGPAREPMKRFWDYINTVLYNEERMGPVWRGELELTLEYQWTVVCPPEDLQKMGQWLDEARELTKEDTVYRQRVDLMDAAVYKAYFVRASSEVRGGIKRRSGRLR